MRSPSLLALGIAVGLSLPAGAAEPVVWTNAVGVTVSGNSLTRGASAASWNTGASSVNVIRDGYGYVECTAAETNLRRMCGLSYGDTNQDYLDIDFAAYLDVGGSLKVYEGTPTAPWSSGTYAAGDKVRVQVANGVVTYWRNGTLVYTSLKKAQYPLRVDTALYDPGATLQDVVVGASGWTGAVGVSVARDTLTKTGAAGWNGGAASWGQSFGLRCRRSSSAKHESVLTSLSRIPMAAGHHRTLRANPCRSWRRTSNRGRSRLVRFQSQSSIKARISLPSTTGAWRRSSWRVSSRPIFSTKARRSPFLAG